MDIQNQKLQIVSKLMKEYKNHEALSVLEEIDDPNLLNPLEFLNYLLLYSKVLFRF